MQGSVATSLAIFLMRREIYISLLILISCSMSLVAQHKPFCGSDEYENRLLKNSDYRYQVQKEEKAYRANALRPKIQKRNNEVTIPVVFHIIHNNGPENISDAEVLQGLEHLNQAFANVGPYQNEEGVDTKIRFCLAQRDNNGNEINGIYRYESPYTDMSIYEGYEYVKSRKIDSTQYINIQVVKEACLGRDCSPAGFAGEYRIVIEANTLNNTAKSATILIHEMGHYLGLKHTWHGGCKNDDCLKDGDKVCDTPPDNRTYDGCSSPSNSCHTDEDDTSNNNPYRSISSGGLGDQPDDKTNFMDYNFLFCSKHFTQGQADRMLFFLDKKYAGLLNSKGCLPPCETVVTSDFDLPDSIEVGSSLTITNLSTNADSYQWHVDGSPLSTSENLTYTFLDEGWIDIQLEAYTNDILCESHIITKMIRVFCPVEACLDYHIQDQYLVFDDCSQNAEDIEWSVYYGSGDNIYASSLNPDSIYVNNLDYVRLCLAVQGQHCSDFICEYITITSDGSEVCGNEEDDDGDGLIDLFDPDCPCEDGAYQAHCQPDCEIIPDSFPDIKMKMKWESEKLQKFLSTGSSFTLIDFKNAGNVQILSSYGKGTLNNFENYLAFIDGKSGNISDAFRVYPEYSFYEFTSHYLVVNSTISSKYNIYTTAIGELLSVNTDGSENFRNSHPAMMGVLGASDFNNDGIPEVYDGDVIFNGENGNILYVGRNRDCTTGTCDFFIPISADVLGNDNKLELITGKYVYNLNLINTSDTTGNSAVVIEAPSGVEDGKCGVGDINGDGELDVISVKGRTTDSDGGIWIWNPRSQTHIAFAESGFMIPSNPGDGSIPFIGDVDGDCFPEIGVVFSYKLNMYKYNGTPNLELLYSLNTSDESGRTGVTMFDFNQDGKQELVYRDENYLRIIEGATGKTIDSILLLSKTWLEYPIIADVDNDGQAEIIVSGSRTSQDEVRMYCFESATTPWAPARSVWNQYAYNPTQVNDDLTIPRYQQKAAQPLQGTENCPRETCNTPYNNFMVQATMRTQEGCYVWPELQRDLSITASSRCVGDSLEICFFASTTDTTTISSGVTVSCYEPGVVGSGGNRLDRITITEDTTCIMMPRYDLDSILIVINMDSPSFPSSFPYDITECDYTNNEFLLDLRGPDFSIDIIDWECTADSLIFYIATDNVGLDTDVGCIGGGCYFVDPTMYEHEAQYFLLERTLWCIDFDTTTMTYQYQDTFRMAMLHPTNKTQMWWTINEGGFGPGIKSSDVTGIYECDYTNNTDGITFDISEKMLDLGPDITKCSTEIFTLNAGSDFERYLWNDLTTDSIYSAVEDGLHFVETTDQCGRVYHDTIMVTIDDSEDINLGDDIILCYDQDTVLTIIGDYDEVYWSPTEMVECDTCMSTSIIVDTSTTLFVQARNDNCISNDTIMINRILPEFDTVTMSSCIGDTIDFFDQDIITDGIYEHLSSDCSSLDVLEAIFTAPDTTQRNEQICSSDSIFFDGQYLNTQGVYEMTTPNILGCDSTIILDLEVVEELSNTDTIHLCENDSTQVFGEWILRDTTVAQSFISSAGCDSTQTISVISNSLPTSDMQVQVCEGDSVLLYGEWYKNDGYYDALVANAEGCDSLIFLEIITKENFTSYDTIIACQGDTIQVWNERLTDDKDIWNTFNASNDCDSTSYFHVEFVNEIESSEEVLLCPEDSIMINGIWIKKEGIFETIYTSEFGCDSIHSIYVSMVPEPPRPNTEIDCEELEIIVSIDAQSEWKPVWSNGDTSHQTSYPSGIMEASLMLYTEPNCEKQFTITLPRLPNSSEIPMLSDTTIKKDQTVMIDLGLDPTEWSVIWNDSSVIDCDTCMRVEISAQEDVEVTIYLLHESGCTYESTFKIEITEEDESIDIPNIFSPNGDDYNDYWTILFSSNIEIIDCRILDRWGNIIYRTQENSPKWDGRFNGDKVEQGVYVYMIRYIDSHGHQQMILGDLTLMR